MRYVNAFVSRQNPGRVSISEGKIAPNATRTMPSLSRVDTTAAADDAVRRFTFAVFRLGYRDPVRFARWGGGARRTAPGANRRRRSNEATKAPQKVFD